MRERLEKIKPLPHIGSSKKAKIARHAFILELFDYSISSQAPFSMKGCDQRSDEELSGSELYAFEASH